MRKAAPSNDSSGFSQRTVCLRSPRMDELEEAYRALPAQGRILIACALTSLAEVLAGLEAAGFFGMMVRRHAQVEVAVEITAYKGKEGPCLDTGKTAVYGGAAAAVVDDDRHVLAPRLRVCQKTATIYALPGYADQVRVQDGDPGQPAALAEHPVPFACDTFEDDVKALAASLAAYGARGGGDMTEAVLYPGPFKLLVLRDGSILRRGQATLMAQDLVAALRGRDGLWALSETEGRGGPGRGKLHFVLCGCGTALSA